MTPNLILRKLKTYFSSFKLFLRKRTQKSKLLAKPLSLLRSKFTQLRKKNKLLQLKNRKKKRQSKRRLKSRK